jgi:hypothetical protein
VSFNRPERATITGLSANYSFPDHTRTKTDPIAEGASKTFAEKAGHNAAARTQVSTILIIAYKYPWVYSGSKIGESYICTQIPRGVVNLTKFAYIKEAKLRYFWAGIQENSNLGLKYRIF